MEDENIRALDALKEAIDPPQAVPGANQQHAADMASMQQQFNVRFRGQAKEIRSLKTRLNRSEQKRHAVNKECNGLANELHARRQSMELMGPLIKRLIRNDY